MNDCSKLSHIILISLSSNISKNISNAQYLRPLHHNICTCYPQCCHSEPYAGSVEAAWSRPRQLLPACTAAMKTGHMETRRHGHRKTTGDGVNLNHGLMLGWTSLVQRLHCCGPPPCPGGGGGGHKSEALHWPVLAWPGPRHTPPHSDLSKHCVLHPASTLYCHNLTSAHQAAELIVLSHCTTV